MNLTTRRLTEGELLSWSRASDRRVWTYRVSDKFGNSGLSGILSLEVEGETARVVDFLLSCRVMGRGVEETMLFTALQYAESVGAKEVQAHYIPTGKNKPCMDFWKRSGFEYDEQASRFCWKFDRPYPKPDQVLIE
jgi:FkbH-like protein